MLNRLIEKRADSRIDREMARRRAAIMCYGPGEYARAERKRKMKIIDRWAYGLMAVMGMIVAGSFLMAVAS